MKHTIALYPSVFVLLLQSMNATEILPITVISATQTLQPLNQTTSDTTIITASELEEKHTLWLKDALQFTNGISTTQTGAVGQMVSLYQRGMDTKHTLVLVDGVKFNDPSVSQAQIEFLSLFDIDHIEIIQGAQSGIWGADATAGVINIITKNPTKPQTTFHAEVGENESKQLSAVYANTYKKLSYKIGINRFSADGISSQTDTTSHKKKYENETDPIYNRTIFGKLHWQFLDEQSLLFSFENIKHNTEYDKPIFDMTTFKSVPQPNSIGYKIENSIKLSHLEYRFSTSPHDIVFYLNQSRFDKEDLLGYQTHFKALIDEFGGHYTYRYAENSSMITGITQQKSKDEIKKRDYTDNALFATNTTVWQQFVFTQSLRYDSYDDVFKSKTTGKLGVKYLFSQSINLFSNIGTGYKSPSMYDLSVASKTLKPESSQTFDMGFEYDHFRAVYFDNTITDLIDYTFDFSTYQSTAFNSDGKSHFKGIDISYDRSLTKSLFAKLNYSYLDAKDKEKKTFANRPKEKVSIALDYNLESYHFGFNGFYIGERDGVSFADYTKRVDTGNYMILNAVLNYNYDENIMAYAKLDNIFDKSYIEVDGYSTLGSTFYIGTTITF